MVDEVEQRVVGPVEILEDEHERPLLGERLEQPAPRGERLGAPVARLVAAAGEPRERVEVGGDPATLLRLGQQLAEHRVELPLHRGDVVGLENAGLRLHDLAERPDTAALAVGERAALPPPVEIGRVVEASHSSATRRLLPIPGTPTSVMSCAVSSLRQRASAS